MRLLPVEPAHRLAERAEEQRWLVTDLWSEQAVSIIGGEPKCCKFYLALDLAVSVAAGTPCLRGFAVPRAGRVPFFAAEDALSRLACHNWDWHQLLEPCSVFAVLIADGERLYDPRAITTVCGWACPAS
jgi:hypothetical protein